MVIRRVLEQDPFWRICHPPKMNIRIYYPQKNLRSTGVGSEMIRFTFLLSPLFIIGSICFRQRYIIFSILPNDRVLFPSEVGGNLAPLRGFPLDDRVAEVVGVQPLFKQIILAPSQFDLLNIFKTCYFHLLER